MVMTVEHRGRESPDHDQVGLGFTELAVPRTRETQTTNQGESSMYKQLKKMRQEEGFTLIELLIVIVILGVLAGIVVFAVGAFNNDGNTAACKADKKNIEIAAEAYLAKVGHYPVGTPVDDSTGRMTTLKNANYIKEIPSNSGYTITLAADGTVGPASC